MQNVWPVTIAGWVALLSGIFALLAMLYGYARGLAQLNGLGGRVDTIEKEVKLWAGVESERALVIDRVVRAQEAAARALGELSAQLTRSDEAVKDYYVQIGSRIDRMIHESHADARSVGERLAGVETALKLRQQLPDGR